MNIGAAAAASGVTAKMIRHYEAIGLLRPAQRRANDYRDYGERDVHELKFIRRARRLGFSMEEIGALLALWRDRGRPSREVRLIAEAHVGELEARIADMQAMAKTLRELVHKCHGDDRPDCPILDDLAQGDDGAPGSKASHAAAGWGGRDGGAPDIHRSVPAPADRLRRRVRSPAVVNDHRRGPGSREQLRLTSPELRARRNA